MMRRVHPAAGEAEFGDICADLGLGLFRASRSGRILSANAPMAAMLGYASVEAMVADVADIQTLFRLDGADQSPTPRLAKLALGVEHACQLRRRDGVVLPVMLVVQPAGENKRTSAFSGAMYVLADVRQSREETLRKALAAAEEANLAKSRFLANISHELRTPLNAITGFSEIMRSERFGPIGNARYREYASDISASAAHLLNVIEDILDLSKAETGRLDVVDEVFDAREVVRTAVNMLSGWAQRDQVEIATNVGATLPLMRADQGKVRQVLINLLSNAIRFSPPKGRVSVSVRQRADGGLTFSISDKGVGIEPGDLARAVEPFVQLDNQPRGAAREGTGLGLSLSKTLIELHGGRLELTSKPGAGTTARAVFPAERSVAR